MKRTLLTLVSVLFCAITFAQSVPQGINYQAVARDASGGVLMNQALTIQFSVISDIATGNINWQETHQVNTNTYGLFTAIIGQGTSTSAGSSATFDVVDWGASNHLLKVEIDYGGGLVDMGTTAFMSVPYSLYSRNLIGCTDSTALNYSTLANTDDGSCIIKGCTDSTASNYNPLASIVGFCCVDGCTDTAASNYNSSATCDDGSCIINGCTDSTATNYNALANLDDGSCIAVVNGCTDATATNYNASANTNDGSCIYPLAIGDTCQGGIIFWLDSLGGGFIAAPYDQSSGVYPYTTTQWGCSGTLISGADGTAIGTGAQNTIDIEAGCATSGTAADLCANLTLGGYSDWFLPSKDELNEMYKNIGSDYAPGNALGLGNVGGFAFNYYWSSTEYDHITAYHQSFYQGTQINTSKFLSQYYVRAIRAISVYGCTDDDYQEFNPSANIDDGSCSIPTTTVFNYTGSLQTLTIPSGVTSISVDAYGASGSISSGIYAPNRSGLGGRVQSTLSVNPGEVLNIYVGGRGETDNNGSGNFSPQYASGGWNGGGSSNNYTSGDAGGGATDIRIGGFTLNDRILVAGGGGGGDGNWGGQGGHGGGLIGGNGSASLGGYGGTQTAGGAGGSFSGTLGVGGNGDGGGAGSGGAGGGGYYGGGGGYGAVAGGGGGSSYTDPTRSNSVIHTQGVQTGHGQITITFQ